jgi:DNA invertase Pin-like site-specific DNA recombinase
MDAMDSVIERDRLDRLVNEAAKMAGYDGFGRRGCDLTKITWWTSYLRQSTKEQAENDRMGEYLLTCARLAKERGVVVPREYIICDHVSSEDFNRPGMKRLRGELIAGRRISGVVVPLQGRLTMDPHHQMTFEKECGYYQVEIVYGDAPGGMDWASRTARVVQAQANELRVMSNRENVIAGNIGRVISGKVPAHKAAYGYRYRRKAEVDQRGRTRILEAWWEIDEAGPDNKPLQGSPA